MSFEQLDDEVNKGMQGLNAGIPMGFERMNRYIGIRKRIFTLLGGSSGSGKTSYVHTAYILNPYDHLQEINKHGIKFKVILFSMERSKIYILAKWMVRKIFLDQGILIPIPKLLGWWDTKLTKDEHDLFLMYKDYLNSLLQVVDIVEGPQNPTGAYKYVKAYAEENGIVEKTDQYNKVYIPSHSNEIVIVVFDHIGLVKPEKGFNKKEAIDKMSEYIQIIRDLYGYTPVGISQLNRNLSNPIYKKVDSFEPTLDDFKESGAPGEAADVVISLFDPKRYHTTDPGYDVDRFIDQTTGGNYFRSNKILKNTYGEDQIRIGLAFHGATGIFKELPRKQAMDGFDYNSLFSGQYFL